MAGTRTAAHTQDFAFKSLHHFGDTIVCQFGKFIAEPFPA
jgi:hypothetical protein